MAPTPVAVTPVGHRAAAVKPSAVACDAVNGNSVPNGGTVLLELDNTGASAFTVVVTLVTTVDGQTVSPLSYSLAAGETRLVGGFPVAYYGSTLVFTAADAGVTVIAYAL